VLQGEGAVSGTVSGIFRHLRPRAFEWAEYFRMDNISLESTFHRLSDDVVRFKIEVGVEEKCTKM